MAGSVQAGSKMSQMSNNRTRCWIIFYNPSVASRGDAVGSFIQQSNRHSLSDDDDDEMIQELFCKEGQ